MLISPADCGEGALTMGFIVLERMLWVEQDGVSGPVSLHLSLNGPFSLCRPGLPGETSCGQHLWWGQNTNWKGLERNT